MTLVDESTKLRIIDELNFYYKFYNKDEHLFKKHLFDDSKWLDSVISFIRNTEVGIIDYTNECIEDKYYHRIVEEIEKTEHTIFIRSSNAYESKFGFHPLTNIALWENHSMPDSNIFDGNPEHTFIKPFKPWDFKHIGVNDKNDRYILSVRRHTPIRTLLFNKIYKLNRKWGCVVRYSDYDESTLTAKSDAKTSDIISDFGNTFITFIVETIYHGMYDDTLNYSINLTEKTLMAFHTKTIPLFFGCKNLVKSLKSMGFHTFDDIFNLNIDDIDTFDDSRRDLYLSCLVHVDEMSFSEIKELYSQMFVKINHNYELVNHLFELNSSIKQKVKTENEFKLKKFG